MKIGIYGGTFNPIHYGHLRTAEEVFEMLSLSRIMFIPSGRTPFKKPDLAEADNRYEMVARAIKGNRHFAVSDIEIKSRRKSYTIDTIKKLKQRYRDDEFFFILGIDAFLDLPCWKQPNRLVNLINFIVISRPGYRFSDLSSSPYLKEVSKNALRGLDKCQMSHRIYTLKNQQIFLCNVTGINISASNIRDMIKSGRNIKYLLPDSVKFYIISHNLYKN